MLITNIFFLTLINRKIVLAVKWYVVNGVPSPIKIISGYVTVLKFYYMN